MTQEEFQNKIRRNNLFGTYMSYFFCIGVICAGLFFIIKNLMDLDWHNGNQVPDGLFYFFTAYLISMGLYGFWRIPAGLRIQTINCNLSTTKRQEILTSLIELMKLEKIEEKENYGRYKYTGRFWSPFDVFLLVDGDGFHINVQLAAYDGGFIDFGTSRRARKKFITALESCIKNSKLEQPGL